MSINLVISEICCNFKELKYKQLQTKIAMITEDKVTEIFCMADDFCKFFDAMTAKYTLKPTGKRKYHRNSTMSKAEVMLIMILFHDSGYRCFKHFYLEKVCKQLRHLFPKVVSYNRIVELERDVVIPLTLFIKKVCSNRFTSVLMKYSFEVLISVTSLKFYFLINYLIFSPKGIFYFFLINTKNEITTKNNT